MIPAARLKRILGRIMYVDTVSVDRQLPAKDDEGADDYVMTRIYTDLPCKLSQYGKELESHKEDRAYMLRTDLRICLDPEYTIKPNDVLTVRHKGQLFVLNAAQAFCYASHQEISIRRRDEA